MKRLVVVMIMVFVIFSQPKSMEASKLIKVYVDSNRVVFDDVHPLIKNGRTLVPLRAIFEEMGAEVIWDGQAKKITATLEENGIIRITELSIGDDRMFVGTLEENGTRHGDIVKIDVPAQVINNRTFVPLRAIGEGFQYEVDWESEQLKVSLTSLKSSAVGEVNPIVTPKEPATPIGLEFERKVIELVNQERKKVGLAPLEVDQAISEAARAKSKDLHDNDYFAHDSPVYGSLENLLDQFGVSYDRAGENLAVGMSSPEDVFRAWMGSKGHRDNILAESFTHIGVGYFKGDKGYVHYWTQLLVTRK